MVQTAPIVAAPASLHRERALSIRCARSRGIGTRRDTGAHHGHRARLVQAPLPSGTGCGLQLHPGHQASQSAAAARLRDELVMNPEGAEPGDVAQMLVGPAAHQLLLIEVVGSGRHGRREALLPEPFFQPVADVADQPVRDNVGLGPSPGSQARLSTIFPAKVFLKGKEEDIKLKMLQSNYGMAQSYMIYF